MDHSLHKLKKTALVILAGGMLFLTMGAPAVTLAFTFPSLKADLESHLWNDRQNVIKNRDTRNALLEASANSTASVSDDSVSSTTVIQGLSFSLFELENIESRIDARTADAAAAGDDISTVAGPLAMADQELTVASTTLFSVVDPADATSSATSSVMTTASSTNIVTGALDSAKTSLGEALDALKAIVGN